MSGDKNTLTEQEVIANYHAIGKAFKKEGFVEGWNACLDDFQSQLRKLKKGDKIVFQYYGEIGDKRDKTQEPQ
jgi:hypothetical protein